MRIVRYGNRPCGGEQSSVKKVASWLVIRNYEYFGWEMRKPADHSQPMDLTVVLFKYQSLILSAQIAVWLLKNQNRPLTWDDFLTPL